jgi:hypothetical protein
VSSAILAVIRVPKSVYVWLDLTLEV